MNLASQEWIEQASLYDRQLSDGVVVPAVVSAILWGVEVAVGKITWFWPL